MNKHHGSKFDDYLKEKGRFEKISALVQKRWEELKADEPSETSEIIEKSPGPITKFFSTGSDMHSVPYFYSQNYTAETKYSYVKFPENSEYGKSRTDSAQLETTSQFSQVD